MKLVGFLLLLLVMQGQVVAQSVVVTNSGYKMSADSNLVPDNGAYLSNANKVGDIYGVNLFIWKTVNAQNNLIYSKAVYFSGYTNGTRLGFIMSNEMPDVLSSIAFIDSLVKGIPDKQVAYNLGLKRSGFGITAMYDAYGLLGTAKWWIQLNLDRNNPENKIMLKATDLPVLKKLFETAYEKLKTY